MRIRLLFALAATATLAACGETVTAPRPMDVPDEPRAELTCRSGYHVATRLDGSQYCEAD